MKDMKKRNIAVIAVVICVITAVLVGIKVKQNTDRQKMKISFLDYQDSVINKEQAEYLSSDFVCTDDISGWVLYKKNEKLFMGIQFFTKGSNNKSVLTSDNFELKNAKIPADGKAVISIVSREKENVFLYRIQSQQNNDALNLRIEYKCEGSCGEYFPNIKVSDIDTKQIYYDSEEQ